MRGSFTQLILPLFLCPAFSAAQQITPAVVNVTGGSAAGSYYRFDWSVGEMCIIETYSKPAIVLENGLLHPGSEKTLIKGPIDFFAIGDILIFPNPAYTTTEVNFKLPTPGKVKMRLTEVKGKLLESREFDYTGAGRIEKIDLQRYPAGTYLLELLFIPTQPNLPAIKGTYKLIHITI